MKTIVYSGTRNLYEQMYISLMSVMKFTADIKAYLLIEDDEFPYKLPENVETMNVSGQTFFRPDGANSRTKYSYMSLMRAALAKVLPNEDKVLSLDCDVLATEDISDVFTYDLDGYYFSASEEPAKSSINRLYTNTGVCLYNLKKLRDDGKADGVIEALNNKRYAFIEQDCFNELCQGHILRMDQKYNATNYTLRCDHPAIIHYAGARDWTMQPLYRKYKKEFLNG